MRDWRLPFWLFAGSIYGLSSGFSWGRWEDLALWTRLHASIEVSTGLLMLACGVALAATRSPKRAFILIGALAPALLGISLVGGTWLGTIPCTGGS
jgi:hypothetical protein